MAADRNIMSEYLNEIGKKSKAASVKMALLSEVDKNVGLHKVADALVANSEYIISENAKDVENAKAAGVSPALVDRLSLNESRIKAMAEGLIQIKDLKDPIGEVLEEFDRPNGLKLQKVRVPMGVIGIIYESRPNVTADAFGLCFKAGNATILRGGKDAINSNIAIVRVIREALGAASLPVDAVILIDNTDREIATQFMKLNKYVDLLIPRGGAGLIRSVVENATIPVIETGTGNCHVYVDESADIDMAVSIIDNAKTQRMGVCNACESLVIHKSMVDTALPKIYEVLNGKSVEIRADGTAKSICTDLDMKDAVEEDFYTEYLGPIISVKVVDNVDEAIDHINKCTTHHSECIVTNNIENAEKFLNGIDAACVYHNASTRFTDGFEFGFGAEIGISTQKLHARGPMGLNEITSYKYKIRGNGQVRG